MERGPRRATRTGCSRGSRSGRPAIPTPPATETPSPCAARPAERERQLGTGYGFGIFVDQALAGEINLNAIQRGPFQNAYIGYWVDEAMAGRAYVPEASW